MTPRQRTRLDATLLAVCPISGTSGDPARIDFMPTATPAQISAAQAALASFDFSDAAQQAWEDAQAPERTSIRQAAAQAIQDNNAFLALATPTNAQVLAQVKRITQECTAIIKRLVQID